MVKLNSKENYMDKNWNITFKLPELPASRYYQAVTVKASNLGLAINRAWAEVKKRQHVKGRRVKQGQVSFEVED